MHATSSPALPTPGRGGRALLAAELLWLGLCLLAAGAYATTAARRLGVAFDEPMLLRAGLSRWRTGSHAESMRLGAMPLATDLAALPLFLLERSRGRPIDVASELPERIALARAVTLLFLTVLLVHGWLLARRLGGPVAAALAAALLATEPNLLAHASLATTDVAAAAGLVALATWFVAGREAGHARRIVLPGVVYGLALLAKGSMLLLAPLTLVALEAHRLGAGRLLAERRRVAQELTALFGIGFGLAVLACGSDFRPEPSFVAWAHGLKEGLARDVLVPLADSLRIFPNAFEALVREIGHNVRGHGVYLLGATHPRSVWAYFPLVLAIKLSLSVLSLLVLVALLRRRAPSNGLLAAAATLLVFSVTYRVQIGVRLVLPLVALLVIGLALSAAAFPPLTALPGRARLLLLAFPAAAALECAAVHPDALVFANALWGGPRRLHLLLSDSNLDWGQGLPDLAAWASERHVETLDVWYFGTDPRIERPPFRMVRLHEAPGGSLRDALELVHADTLAVSATALYGSYLGERGRAIARELREATPVGRTATFFVYDARALRARAGERLRSPWRGRP